MGLRISCIVVLLSMGGGCKKNAGRRAGESYGGKSCGSGELCVEGKCRKVCDRTSDCARGYACRGNICVAGTGTPPVIYDITADGVADPDPTHVSNRIRSRLRITGDHFEEPEVSLQGPGGPWDLEICAASTQTLEVVPPPALVSEPGDVAMNHADMTANRCQVGTDYSCGGRLYASATHACSNELCAVNTNIKPTTNDLEVWVHRGARVDERQAE